MKKNESDKSSEKMFLTAFNSKKRKVSKRHAHLDASWTAVKKQKNEPLAEEFTQMVEWLQKYSPKIVALYKDDRNLKLAAEATYWSFTLGLEPFIKKMDYAEVRNFSPLEATCGFSDFSVLLNKVSKKLTGPAFDFEVSYALGQAAWAMYAKEKSFEVMQEERVRYKEEAKRSSGNRM